jgi:hypothetical protein
MLSRRHFIATATVFAAVRCTPSTRATTFPAVDIATARHLLVSLDEQHADGFRSVLGEYGVLSIRSRSRLLRLLSQLETMGWKRPDAMPLLDVAFDRQSVVCVFNCGDAGNELSLRAQHPPTTHVGMSYVLHKQRDRAVIRPSVLLFEAPANTMLHLTTFHPHNGGVYPSFEKGLLEWSSWVGPDGGEAVGRLMVSIATSAKEIARGDDVKVSVRLALSTAEKAEGHFSRMPPALTVWDGKYSNGYRNHAFHIARPDGSEIIVRPPEREFGKNAPRPVRITANEPYVLPEWFEGATEKSLRDLGERFDQPGTYRITGIYSQSRGAENANPRLTLWSGEAWGNTLTVRVRK